MASIVPVISMIVYAVIFLAIAKSLTRQKKSREEQMRQMKQPAEPKYTSGQMDYTKNLDEDLKNMTVTVNGKPQKLVTAVQEALSEGPAETAGIRTAETFSGETPAEAQVSTTDYLAEKARLDQIDHAREKREEIKRLREKSGGLFPAERLYDGDPVPAGKHCVVCGYCAAENLVPDGAVRKYSCYFCREPLQHI